MAQITSDRIQKAILEVEKRCGKGTIMALGEAPIEDIAVFPTGSLLIDRALGIGGVPHGRLVEIYGPESSGKTSLALSIIAQAQKSGFLCAFIDAEHALDMKYASKLGVDKSTLMISQPDYGEQALEIIDILVSEGGVNLIVLDSVAALVPRAEIEGEMTDNQIGLQARLMSKAMRKITSHCSKNNCTVIFINQIRMKIGVMFGSPEVTPGGNALKFFSSVRIDIRKTGHVKEGEEILGNKIRVKVVKNKMAPPFTVAETDFYFDCGFNEAMELCETGLKVGIITKAGSWYSYGDRSIGQGKDKACAFLKENPDIMDELRTKIVGLSLSDELESDAG
ncbi:recombinase RecA [Myxococcota bacterium]|nr:recombinase RecA [Myxococcota bacterium]MBU1379184.1 recombinase RecA [Myxococcota bacterium]MBU1496607.1 recombinase RecA [Myxococcota bacterium]